MINYGASMKLGMACVNAGSRLVRDWFGKRCMFSEAICSQSL